MLFGALLTLAAIPFPYYVRVIIYVLYEADEMDARKDALDALSLDPDYSHNVLHMISPFNSYMILVYVTCLVTFLLLAAFRDSNAEKFDQIAVSAIHDLRHVKRVECLTLFAAHLVLPFEKFGICGIVIGAIYWPIVLPICLLVGIGYCFPTIYLTGRFLIQSRPSFLYSTPRPTAPMHVKQKTSCQHRRTLSGG